MYNQKEQELKEMCELHDQSNAHKRHLRLNQKIKV
jgi:hypothetical protein